MYNYWWIINKQSIYIDYVNRIITIHFNMINSKGVVFWKSLLPNQSCSLHIKVITALHTMFDTREIEIFWPYLTSPLAMLVRTSRWPMNLTLTLLSFNHIPHLRFLNSTSVESKFSMLSSSRSTFQQPPVHLCLQFWHPYNINIKNECFLQILFLLQYLHIYLYLIVLKTILLLLSAVN